MSDNIKLSIEDMNLYYGNFHALHDINMHIPEKEITAFIFDLMQKGRGGDFLRGFFHFVFPSNYRYFTT